MKASLKFLERKIVRFLTDAGRLAEETGLQIYLVGGAVRDVMLGKRTQDIDLVMEGDAIQFGRKLVKRMGGNLTVHAGFGTASLVLPGGQRVDLVTARRETYAQPGALPRVAAGNMREDAFRRDFTINSMALSLNPGTFGQVLDFYGGMADLKAGRVRVLHDASFYDDPTRIFRAVRYERRYGFHIARSTLSLLKQAVAEQVFETISMQRYVNEVEKVFEENNPVPAVRRLAQLRVFRHLHARIRIPGAFLGRFHASAQKQIYPGKWSEISITTLYWMVLLSGSSSAVRRQIIGKLPLAKARRKAVEQLDDLHKMAGELKRGRMRPSVVFYKMKGLSEEALCYLWELCRTFKGRANIQVFLHKREEELRITGADLREMGVPTGRAVGELLKQVFNEKLDKGLQTKSEELDAARAIIQKTP